MPVDQKALLKDCQKQLKLLEADLKVQSIELAELDASLRSEFAEAQAAGRVGDAFEIWRGEQITQGAVHWVLGCVFVRFLEDNKLIDALLAGDDDAGRIGEAAEQAYYTSNPTHHARDWLWQVFRHVAALPGGTALFDESHNPAFRWPLSPDASKKLLRFWRQVNPTSGSLLHNFVDQARDTRFLGDLYQNLSESARKKYALLQTPEFVEEFILERTLGEALKVLPLSSVTVIDPTSGSGHFLLGAFTRILAEWERSDPAAPREALVQRALDQVAGVDLNPFAVAIARFRLLIAALVACGVSRLERAPSFKLHIAVGDSLLHGDEPGLLALGDGGRGRFVRHAFGDEDLVAVNAILGRRYAVVVGNPPYITPKDAALRVAYKQRYESCYMRYALSVPFVERFWELATSDAGGGTSGWVGQITANSFMKREFGKKLIEQFFPSVDLTHVIDAGGAYIPGHGTPTVLLFGRARRPSTDRVRAVLGILGEPATPEDPSNGEVWTAIVEQLDHMGSASRYVSVEDVPRAILSKHPWSLGGGGASEVKLLIEDAGERTVADLAVGVGIGAVTGEDAFFILDRSSTARRSRIESVRSLVIGDAIRDWTASAVPAIWPYDDSLCVRPLSQVPNIQRASWTLRSSIAARKRFGVPMVECGLAWYEWQELYREKLTTPLTIASPEVATHNHFTLDRERRVFKNSASVIKLPKESDESTHLGLVGLLNSSTACFWLKQVAHNKGSTVDQAGARQRTAPFEDFYSFNATKIAAFPVAAQRPSELAKALDDLAKHRNLYQPEVIVAREMPTREALREARATSESYLARMIAMQEELDWRCYFTYGLTETDLSFQGDFRKDVKVPPQLKLGERAFEIVLARLVARGEAESTWFERHGSTPVTEIPNHWPDEYRLLVENRISNILQNSNVKLIERPEYKRRWNLEKWESLESAALDAWLLERLESPLYWPTVALQSTRELAERAAVDTEFGRVAGLRFGDGVAVEAMIRELALGESVPFLPILRYSESGLEKRVIWQRTWALQRMEDEVSSMVAAESSLKEPLENESVAAIAARVEAAKTARIKLVVGHIPRPPKYSAADFLDVGYWRARGTLDVPRERFISYAWCNRDGDDAPLLGWAGWTHLQQAQALSAWYADRNSQDGWSGERLVPMLAGMSELVPWLRQWHNEIDPEFGDRPGEAYALWLDQELQSHGLTRASLDSWEPPRAAQRRSRRAATSRLTPSKADQT